MTVELPRKVQHLDAAVALKVESPAETIELLSPVSLAEIGRRPVSTEHQIPNTVAMAGMPDGSAQPTPSRPNETAEGARRRESSAKGENGSRSGVSVVLMVSEDGTVGEIYWGQLPALTDEQLRILETLIRQRLYPSNLDMLGTRRINETIDVRALLKLPPASGLAN